MLAGMVRGKYEISSTKATATPPATSKQPVQPPRNETWADPNPNPASPCADGSVVRDGVRLHARVDHLEEEVQSLSPLAALFASRDGRAVANHIRLHP